MLIEKYKHTYNDYEQIVEGCPRHHWSKLNGVQSAIEYLKNLSADTVITIAGDYDCDGVCATVILKKALEAAGFIHVHYVIPNRVHDGYGLSKSVIDRMVDETQVIITCDNGIAAVDALEYAASKRMDVLVTDHHKATEDTLQRIVDLAVAVVHPRYQGTKESSVFAEISGAQTAYKIWEGIQENWNIDDPDLDRFLFQLSALTIVSDVMPQYVAGMASVNENRQWLKDGLESLATQPDDHLKQLMQVMGVYNDGTRWQVDETTIGFYLAPAINACGRLADADLAVDSLLADDPFVSEAGFQLMGWLNNERKKLKTSGIALCEQLMDSDSPAVCVFAEEVHEGIIGILAGQLASKYEKPAIVCTRSGSVWKGSARSVPGVDLFEPLHQLLEEGILTSFGGHAAAAGLSVDDAHREEFVSRFYAAMQDAVSKQEEIVVDYDEIPSTKLNVEAKSLLELKPFGEGLSAPKCYSEIFFNRADIFWGSEHVKLSNPYGQSIWLYGQAEKVAKALDGYHLESDNTDKRAETMSLSEARKGRHEVWAAPYGLIPKWAVWFTLDYGWDMNHRPAPVINVEDWERMPFQN